MASITHQRVEGECKGSTLAQVRLLSVAQRPVCKVGTGTPTLPAILGGTWGSGNQRMLQHTPVLGAFSSIHRCTKKRTISKGYKEQLGLLGRKGEGRGDLVVSLNVLGQASGSPFPTSMGQWWCWRLCRFLVTPRTSAGTLSCPYPTHNQPPRPVRVPSSPNLQGPGLPTHVHSTAVGLTFSLSQTKPWPLHWPPSLSSLFSSLSPHGGQSPVFNINAPCYSPAQNCPISIRFLENLGFAVQEAKLRLLYDYSYNKRTQIFTKFVLMKLII